MSPPKKFVTALSLVVLGLSVIGNADDGGICSNETLHGSYAFHATGERFAAVARFTFDGNGGLTAIFFGRSPGNPFGPVELTGTYSVDWIYGHGKGYFILNSSPEDNPDTDTVNSGEAIRQ